MNKLTDDDEKQVCGCMHAYMYIYIYIYVPIYQLLAYLHECSFDVCVMIISIHGGYCIESPTNDLGMGDPDRSCVQRPEQLDFVVSTGEEAVTGRM